MNVLLETSLGTINWIWRNIIFDVPWFENYFWGLTIISLIVWVLELRFPWRKEQSLLRKGFWLDAFYMYFNFFMFSIIISGVYALLADNFIAAGMSLDSLILIDIYDWPLETQLLVFFVLSDFLKWVTHRILHRVNFLWRFHRVHHSIKEMGFAGHLRYHWVENILYKPLKILSIMLIGGFEPEQAFIVHFFAISIGHLNHANIKLTYGPLKYIFNNPVMHLQHHAYHLPKEHRYGVNFGMTLSIWDYMFGTAYLPKTDGNLVIGYPNDEKMPQNFFKQCIYGFKKAQ